MVIVSLSFVVPPPPTEQKKEQEQGRRSNCCWSQQQLSLNDGHNGSFVLLDIGLCFQVVLLVVQFWNHVTPHLLLMEKQDDEKHLDADGSCLTVLCCTNNKKRNEIMNKNKGEEVILAGYRSNYH